MSNSEKLLDLHFNGQVNICASNKIVKENYEIIHSNILDDYYWNVAVLKDDVEDFENVWEEIKQDMKRLNRQSVLYIVSGVDEAPRNGELENIYTDVWMILEDLENFEDYESKIDVEISRVENEEKDRWIEAVMDGFSGDDPNDPYGTLPEEYRIWYQKSFKVTGKYSTINYCGKHNDEIIATANVWYKDDCAIIYTVSTKKKFQKQGVCKKLMSYIILCSNRRRILHRKSL